MSTLTGHLEQISLSAKSIADLEFPPPKIFTNALLTDHEITTLIRDTEPHERALFTLDPDAVSSKSRQSRKSIYPSAAVEAGVGGGRKSIFPAAQPVKQSAITRLLGTEMLQEIRQSSADTARARGRVNVEVLLRGAEKLNDAYNVPGVGEKIKGLRSRHQELATSIASYEAVVSSQQSMLDHRTASYDADEYENDTEARTETGLDTTQNVMYTEADFRLEEEEIRELEAKKKALEDRVSGLERDLGGLLR